MSGRPFLADPDETGGLGEVPLQSRPTVFARLADEACGLVQYPDTGRGFDVAGDKWKKSLWDVERAEPTDFD